MEQETNSSNILSFMGVTSDSVQAPSNSSVSNRNRYLRFLRRAIEYPLPSGKQVNEYSDQT